MPIDSTRACAVLLLLVASAALLALCRVLAASSRRPLIYWGAGGYLVLLHLVCIIGLITSAHFENGLPQIALLTFPCSMSVFDVNTMEGFVTPHDLAANYVRYLACFGGLNAVAIGIFFALVVPARRLPAH